MKQSVAIRLLGNIVLPRYQVLFVIVSFVIISFLTYKPLTEFYSSEPMPHLIPIMPLQIKEWGGGSAVVNVGMYIINFPEFDIVQNNFVLDGIVWFEFDPSLVSLETVGKFTFEKGEIKRKTDPFTKIINDKFFARYNVRLRFTTNLSYKLFPLDDHRLYIALINRSVSPSEMIFQSYESDFFLSDSIYTAGWKEVKRQVRTGYAEAQLDEFDPRKTVLYPKVVFSLNYKQDGIRRVLLILLPLFLMFFMGLYSLSFDPKEHSGKILSLASAGVTSLLAYRFVIERMTPNVDYFVLSDQAFTFFLVVALIEFIFGVYVIREKTITNTILVFRGLLFLSAHIFAVVFWYYLIYRM